MKNSKLEKLYKKGIISEEEYNNRLGEITDKSNVAVPTIKELDNEYIEHCKEVIESGKKIKQDKER